MSKKFTIKNQEKFINIITAISITLFMLFLNFNCGYASDDWHFKFMWEQFDVSNGVKRIQSLNDIILSVKNYYNLSGGRALCHGLLFFINMFDKPVFNVVNSLIFTGFSYASYVLVKKITKSQNTLLFPIICLAYVLTLPYFGDNCLWLSGAVNYLWSAAIMVCCFVSIEKYAVNPNAIKMIILCVCVMLSSLTNETTGGMIIIYMLITFAIERKFRIYDIIPFIPAVVGTIIVVAAPGNMVRFQGEIADSLTIGMIIKSALEHCETIFIKFYIHVFIFLFALVLTITIKKSLKLCIEKLKLLITGFAGILALSITGFNHFRLYFIGCIALICGSLCCIVYIYNLIASEYKTHSDKIKISLIIPSLICILGYAVSLVFYDGEFSFVSTFPIIVMVIILFIGMNISKIIEFINKVKNDDSLKKKIGNPKRCLKIALILTITPYIILNSAILASNNIKRKEWFDNVILQLEQKNYQNLVALSDRTNYPYDFSGAFDADQACFQDPRWYVTSWFAYYNGYYLNTKTQTVEILENN